MPKTYETIATTTLTSAASSISFTSIPATYTDLVIIGVPVAELNNTIYADWTFNGSNAADYGRWVWGQAGGSVTYDNRNGNRNRMELDVLEVQNLTSYAFIINVNDYSNTTTYKNMIGITINAGMDGTQGFNYAGGMWQSTAAVNRVDMLPNDVTKNWGSGTIVTLYGIKAA